jgi:hypothetical protein
MHKCEGNRENGSFPLRGCILANSHIVKCEEIAKTPASILTIDNLRLGGVEGESKSPRTLSKDLPEPLGLVFHIAVTNHIICVPFKPHVGPMFLHPHVI